MSSEPGPSYSFVSPEDIRGYPKAAPRKESGRGRKRGRSMIATDTLEKEGFAEGRSKSQKCTQSKDNTKT